MLFWEPLWVIIRVAQRILAEREIAPEKMEAILLKLRKKAYGTLGVKQINAALRYLGWKVEEVIGLEQVHGYGAGKPIIVLDKDPDLNRQKWQEMKDLEVEKLPSHPTRGKRYTMDVSDFGPMEGYGPQYPGFTYREWWGRPAYRYVTPEGKLFDLVAKVAQDLNKVRIEGDFIRWLYGETNLVSDISKAVSLPTPDEEKADRGPRTRENTGSCPCCFGNYKLKGSSGSQHPTIVLHGFKRPGWGQVFGSCYGVNFPPFELSPDGTKHLVKILDERLDGLKEHLQKLRAGRVTELYVPVGKTTKKVTLESEGEAAWAKLVSKDESKTEDEMQAVARDLRTLGKLISAWKPQPLPDAGKSLTVWK